MRFHSHLSGGLRLRNYSAVAGNHKISSRFSVFGCFCGGYSNRVKRLRRAVILSWLKLLSLTKDYLLGIDQVSQGFHLCPRPCGEGWGGIRPGFKASKGSQKPVERWSVDDVANADIIKCVKEFYP